ncbi:MAG: hypothetical protein AAF441_07670 [Pseudomonadota bacterium]
MFGRAVIVGAAVSVLAGCKTTSTETTGSVTGNQPGTVQIADTSILTGSIDGTGASDAAVPAPARSGTLTTADLKVPAEVALKPGEKAVKTVALGNAATGTAASTKRTLSRMSLTFPKDSYTLASDQTADLSALVQKAKTDKRKVKVIGIAQSRKGKKHAKARAKARLAANRRAKAASMFLRVYGLTAKDMIVTTADERAARGKNANRVDIVLQ